MSILINMSNQSALFRANTSQDEVIEVSNSEAEEVEVSTNSEAEEVEVNTSSAEEEVENNTFSEEEISSDSNDPVDSEFEEDDLGLSRWLRDLEEYRQAMLDNWESNFSMQSDSEEISDSENVWVPTWENFWDGISGIEE